MLDFDLFKFNLLDKYVFAGNIICSYSAAVINIIHKGKKRVKTYNSSHLLKLLIQNYELF